MAHTTESQALFDACNEQAIKVGRAMAATGSADAEIRELRIAITMYLDSIWYIPVDERPTPEQVVDLLMKGAYVTYLHALGAIQGETVGAAFNELCRSYPSA